MSRDVCYGYGDVQRVIIVVGLFVGVYISLYALLL